MATPSENESELERLRRQLREAEERLRQLRVERAREAQQGFAALMASRVEGAGPPQKPVREEGESRGHYIGRLRSYYAVMRAQQRSMQRTAAAIARHERIMALLPPLPVAPNPGESREDFLRRVREVAEERARIYSEMTAQARAEARSTTSTFTEEEIKALAQRTERDITRRAIEFAQRMLKAKAAAERIEVPLVPDPGESKEEFQERRAIIQYRKDQAYLPYLEARAALDKIEREKLPEEERLEQLLSSGAPPQFVAEAEEALKRASMQLAAENRSKRFAFLVDEILEDPQRFGLTQDGVSARERAEEMIRRAEVAATPSIPPLNRFISQYSEAAGRNIQLVKRATDMLNSPDNQVKQWIGFRFLSSINRLPEGFTQDMISNPGAAELERQAKDYLMEHGGFIGNIDHTSEIESHVVEAGPPVVLGPPEPTDFNEIIVEAVGELAGHYAANSQTMDDALNQILLRWVQGSMTPEEYQQVLQLAATYNLNLPPSPGPRGLEAALTFNPEVQDMITNINNLKRQDDVASRRTLKAIVANLFADYTRGGPESDVARYILEQTGMLGTE